MYVKDLGIGLGNIYLSYYVHGRDILKYLPFSFRVGIKSVLALRVTSLSSKAFIIVGFTVMEEFATFFVFGKFHFSTSIWTLTFYPSRCGSGHSSIIVSIHVKAFAAYLICHSFSVTTLIYPQRWHVSHLMHSAFPNT